MTPKYKLGDTVRVKSWDFITSHNDDEGPGINEEMELCANKEFKITFIDHRNLYQLEGAVYDFCGSEFYWVWKEEWLEPVCQFSIDKLALSEVLQK